MNETTKTDAAAIAGSDMLLAGFPEEDNYIEGVFIIGAKSKETFFYRQQKLEDITGFTTGGFGSYEKDDDGGGWKIITMGKFEGLEDLKIKMNKLKKYKWLYWFDSDLLFDGKEIFSSGEWLI
jgi:hypothetical protein